MKSLRVSQTNSGHRAEDRTQAAKVDAGGRGKGVRRLAFAAPQITPKLSSLKHWAFVIMSQVHSVVRWAPRLTAPGFAGP